MKTLPQQQMPRWLTYTLLSGLATVFVLMPFHAFLSTWGGTALGPLWLWKSWKEIVLAGLLLLVAGWLISAPAAARQLFSRRFVWVLVAYVTVALGVTALNARQIGSEALLAGLAMSFRYLLAGVVSYVTFCYGGLSERWLVGAKKYLVAVGVFVALLGILQALVVPMNFLTQFGYDEDTTIAPYTLIDNNPELLRAFATLRGPNDFGAFLILPLLLAATYLRRQPLTAGLCMIIMTWALVLSSSRSAWLGAVAAFVVLGLLLSERRLSRRRLVAGLSVAGALAVGLLMAAMTVAPLRMAVFHSSPGDSSLTEGSTDNHLVATLSGMWRVAENPLGCGVGCAGPASYYGSSPRISESYVVQVAEEVGVLGFALFALFVGMIGLMLYRAKVQSMTARLLLAALVGYMVIGLLLHVWADDPLTIVWWTLAGGILGYNERQSWKKK